VRGTSRVVVGSDEGAGAPAITGAKGASGGSTRTHVRQRR
jgi:hypothetical protein